MRLWWHSPCPSRWVGVRFSSSFVCVCACVCVCECVCVCAYVCMYVCVCVSPAGALRCILPCVHSGRHHGGSTHTSVATQDWKTDNPTWLPIMVPKAKLCGSNEDALLIIEVFHARRCVLLCAPRVGVQCFRQRARQRALACLCDSHARSYVRRVPCAMYHVPCTMCRVPYAALYLSPSHAHTCAAIRAASSLACAPPFPNCCALLALATLDCHWHEWAVDGQVQFLNERRCVVGSGATRSDAVLRLSGARVAWCCVLYSTTAAPRAHW